MKKILCDRCGNEIEKDKHWIATFDVVNSDPIDNDALKFDLCPRCFDILRKQLEHF